MILTAIVLMYAAGLITALVILIADGQEKSTLRALFHLLLAIVWPGTLLWVFYTADRIERIQ